jgi:hypothetical protein
MAARTAPVSPYDRLDPDKVVVSVGRTRDRIAAALPGRHLADVADEVCRAAERVARESVRRTPWRTALVVGSRVAIVVLVGLIGLALASAVRAGLGPVDDVGALDWLSIVESGVNDVVFAAIAIWFLRSVPDRVERRRLLGLLHRLRSLAHVVDMHQMTKDADKSLPAGSEETETSGLGPADLGRYYDYCSELLSLISKVAALCGEGSTDAVVLSTVGEVETLTSSMSRKIWQKISLLRLAPPVEAP